METTMQTTTASAQTAQAAEYQERTARAADYTELVWQEQGTEEERALLGELRYLATSNVDNEQP
ncbi:hypothetical protein [Streptomyces sp. NPDC012825]|uniref:hypothetical protein n=1 Tax=Streptomyces sp. NPDC012825 TaxID=3364851 RepID=UPI0036C98B27